MTPIRTLTLALVCAVALTCVQTAHAQIGTTCTITGTVYQVDGITPAAGATLTVTRADKAGKLYANTSRVYSTNSNGVVSFKVPRTIGTDTAVIHVKASFGNLAAGQILYVPSDSTATLESLVRYTANPTFVVVAVPTSANDSTQTIFDPSGTQKIPASRLDVGAITGDTTGTTNQPMQGRFENMLGQFTAGTSDSLQQTAANVYVARNVAEGKANADSVHTVLVALSNLIAGKGSADSIHSQLVTLYNLVAGKPSADSVHTAIAAMLKMSDTTALHAQKFAIINDSLFAISLRATSTANDLTAHIGAADAHLPSQTGQAGKFLQSNGTVSSWQPESDPTAIPRTDSTRFVSRTAPQIPGLASADTNTVIGVDASGNLVLRKDDAGTGGSSIDSNRIVRHDIIAPKVAATYGAFDSLRIAGTIVRDTLGYIVGDSAVWRVAEVRIPKSQKLFADGGVGYIIFEIEAGDIGLQNLHWKIVGDSVNSVYLGSYHIEQVGFRTPQALRFESGNWYERKGTFYTSTGYDFSAGSTDVVNQPGPLYYFGTNYQVKAYQYSCSGAQNPTRFSIRIKQWFMLPSTSTSTWYARIEEL